MEPCPELDVPVERAWCRSKGIVTVAVDGSVANRVGCDIPTAEDLWRQLGQAIAVAKAKEHQKL